MEFNLKLEGIVLSEQTREVVANVTRFMRREAEEKRILKYYKKFKSVWY